MIVTEKIYPNNMIVRASRAAHELIHYKFALLCGITAVCKQRSLEISLFPPSCPTSGTGW